MSGVFRPEQNATIEATDDPELAKQHGLTEWNEARGQFVAPPQPSDAGQRDGYGVEGHEAYDADRAAGQQPKSEDVEQGDRTAGHETVVGDDGEPVEQPAEGAETPAATSTRKRR